MSNAVPWAKRRRPHSAAEDPAAGRREASSSKETRVSEPALERHLARALDQTSPLITVLTRTGEVMTVNPTALATGNLARADVVGRPIWETPWWSGDTAVQLQLKRAVAAAAATGESVTELDMRAVASTSDHEPEDVIPTECHIVAEPNEAGKRETLTMIVTDLTHRRSAEARQLLLTAELDHRLKNMLLVIQAMIGQTARYARSSSELVAGLQGRVRTMAEVQNLLMRSNAAHVDLRALVTREIQAIVSDPAICRIEGQPLQLSPRGAMAMSLVIHELATNAAKYGAFVGPGGHLKIDWQRVAGEGDGRLNLTWTERSPMPIAPPVRTGFGTHLIGQTVRVELGGRATFGYPASGLVCVLSLPLDPLQHQG